MVCVRDNGGWPDVRRRRSTSRVRGDTLISPPSRCAALGWVDSELVGLPGRALACDAMRLRFVVRAAG